MLSNTIRRVVERVNRALDNEPIIDAYDLGYLHGLHATLQDLWCQHDGTYIIDNRSALDWMNDIQDTINRGLLITQPV